MARQRARELGVPCGHLTPGKYNAITDVEGVRVGHVTLHDGDICSGVTAVLPHEGNLFQEKVVAASHVLNGFGKTLGLAQINELGQLETPILLTSTLSAPKVADALISWMLASDSTITSLNPVVGECNDSYLNDIRARPVLVEHVFAALDSATTGMVAEGAVGGGVGMTAYGYKGGIGTSSRVLDTDLGGFTVGMLVMANFGSLRDLRIAGVPVGSILLGKKDSSSGSTADSSTGDGSIMMVLATDAPLSSRQLLRLAKRAPLGLARTGTAASHGSGDFVLAFSTAERIPNIKPDGIFARPVMRLYEDGRILTALFSAVVEATEEAIYNALFMAETTTGFQGRRREALPIPEVLQVLRDCSQLVD